MDLIQLIPDFPSKGIHFRHIGPLLANFVEFDKVIDGLVQRLHGAREFDVIAALDARGFIIGTALQYKLALTYGQRTSLVMIRKAGKLPLETLRSDFGMEYGDRTLELEVGAIPKESRVIVVDDLFATGGSAFAAADLVHKSGSEVLAIVCVIRLTGFEEHPNPLCIRIISMFEYGKDSTEQRGTITPVAKQHADLVPREIHPSKVVLMWHPSLEQMAERLCKASAVFAPYMTRWNTFPDSWPDVTFRSDLENKHVVYLMSMEHKSTFLEQISLLKALPSHGLESLNIVIPYLGPATHERATTPGTLATVEPVLKVLSKVIPHTNSGPTRIRILDVHAPPSQFYADDASRVILTPAITALFINGIDYEFGNMTIVFPDKGAYQRFGTYFQHRHIVICSKTRIAGTDKREVKVSEMINWPEDEAEKLACMDKMMIVDDLCQSGSTLIECAAVLKQMGAKHIRVYVTHAVFPNDSWKRFVDNDLIDEFYVTNTIPGVTNLPPNKFRVIEIEPLIARDLCRALNKQYPDRPEPEEERRKILSKYMSFEWYRPNMLPVYIASMNETKLSAGAFGRFRAYGVDHVPSGVPEQPIGDETHKGAENRLNVLRGMGLHGDKIAFESGIFIVEYGFVDKVVCKMFSQELGVVETGESGGLTIPQEDEYLIDWAREKNTTFGALYEKKYGLKPGSWHRCTSGRSRTQQMTEAYRACVSKFRKNIGVSF